MTPKIWVATTEGVVRDGEVELEGHSVAALERRDKEWWAVVDDHELWRRDARGSWSRAGVYDAYRLTSILPLDDRVLGGTSEAHLVQFAEGSARLVESFDAVEGRAEWFTPWGGPPDIRSMAIDDAGPIFVNIHVGGIARSDDGGATWSPTIDINSDVHEVISDGGVVLAATAAGLALSRDDGTTWEFDTDGLHASYARAVALSDSTILMTASVGPFGGNAALYRRPLDATGFVKCEEGLPEWFSENINTAWLTTSGSHVAFGTHDGRVFLSEDVGLTWSQVAKDLPEVRAVRLSR